MDAVRIDREKLLKIMMEQGRKISQDIDADLQKNGKVTREGILLLDDLEKVNRSMERQFKLWVSEGRDNVTMMLQATKMTGLLKEYFEDTGYNIKAPSHEEMKRKAAENEELKLIELLGELINTGFTM